MSTHASDVAFEMRQAAILAYGGLAGDLHTDGKGDTFVLRDGTITFGYQPRDCMRTFRITVEIVSDDEVDVLTETPGEPILQLTQ